MSGHQTFSNLTANFFLTQEKLDIIARFSERLAVYAIAKYVSLLSKSNFW